jgi:membrane protein implicated in regulation of membrane protease activity
MKSSKLFSLNIYDFLKGIIVAVLTPIIVFAQGYFANGTLDIEWQALMAVGFSGLLAYLIKNFFSDAPNESRLTTTISNEDINAVVGNRPNDRSTKK